MTSHTIHYPTVPSFTAHRSDRKLYAHIDRAFLRDLEVDRVDLATGLIILPDGSEWTLILESVAELDEITDFGSCHCIVSFQLWKDGRAWAVARKDRGSSQRGCSE